MELNNNLTYVLTLSTSGTGRDDEDLKRARLLFESFSHFCRFQENDTFLIVCPGSDNDLIRQAAAPWAEKIRFQIHDETTICPELADDPETTNAWPRPNKGWFRQQLIKLAIHEYVHTPFYMTLDSDVIFVRDFDSRSLFRNGQAILNVQGKDDFIRLYKDNFANKEERIRINRYRQAEKVLGIHRKDSYAGQWYGETPVLLHRGVVAALAEHIESTWNAPWRQALLDNLPWTEYALYFLFAEESGLLPEHYHAGTLDTLLRLSDSLWLPAERYRQSCDLDNWDPAGVFNTDAEGVAVVIQSYLGYPVEQLAGKVAPFLR